jgi:hypothetical protein
VIRRIFEEHERYGHLREWLKAEFRKPEAERDPAARSIFSELGFGDEGVRRSLLESEAFRALLDAQSLARAA